MRHFHHRISCSNYFSNYFSNSRFQCNETRVIFITSYILVITYSYSRFHFNEARVIFITGHVAVITLVIPASIAMKHAPFLSLDT